ncbi:hypothetical protein OEA41_006726 [Lepraria neglecta]|uniref:Uncharacterized protein n=1 Tax=Lepraria neglecta TaxID=209136 RepID=A0AAE0DKI5_9LECA|nr:hypothetical protein OEA41_006726 [Lepraria neglecta]
MDRLPTEIVSLILDDVSGRHVRGGISSNGNAGIKAMRLCCRQFAELAADYIYSEVWLFANEDSAAKAMTISQHLSYSSMVYSLKIFPKLLSDEFLVKEEYETYIRGLQIYNEGKEYWGFDAEGNRDLSDEQIDAGFAEYTKLYGQQLEFSAKMQAVLNRLLPAFPRLEVLTLGFATQMLEKYDMMSWPGSLRPTKDGSFVYTTPRTLPWLSEQSESVVRWPPLHGLALCCDNAFLNFSPEDKDIAMESVMYLSHLSLEVWSNDYDVLVNVIESGKLREFLEWTSGSEGLCQCDPTYPWVTNPPQGLLILSLSLGETWNSPGSLSDILGTIHWPCLQKFELTSFSFSLKELIDFFNRHRSSLLYLGLNEVILRTGSWYEVFTGMRGPKALRTLHLRSLLLGDYQREDDEFFREHGDDRELLEAVTKYVFEGEAWPSTLPRGFKREVGEVLGDP